MSLGVTQRPHIYKEQGSRVCALAHVCYFLPGPRQMLQTPVALHKPSRCERWVNGWTTL